MLAARLLLLWRFRPGWEPRAPHTRRAHASPRLCSRSPQPLAHPTPAGTTQLVSPLAGPGMPKNEVTGVQSPGSGGWAGRVDSTHRLSPAEAPRRAHRTPGSPGAAVLQVFEAREKGGGTADSFRRQRAIEKGHVYGGPGSCRGLGGVSGHFRPLCKKCRQTPILTLPLFSHFLHFLRTRRPGPC